MKKTVLTFGIILASLSGFAQEKVYPGNYELAARFSPEKLKKMIFSTSVDAHWMKNSDRFWYEYETSDGKTWYVVDPLRKTKTPLFDKDKLAAEITKAVKDPFDGQHLKLDDLKLMEDENTVRFKVKSTADVLKSDWAEIKEKNKNAKDSMEKKVHTFLYNISTQQLTEIETEKDPKRLAWANISPDSCRVVYMKEFNLYWLDKSNSFVDENEENLDVEAAEKDMDEMRLGTDSVSFF